MVETQLLVARACRGTVGHGPAGANSERGRAPPQSGAVRVSKAVVEQPTVLKAGYKATETEC